MNALIGRRRRNPRQGRSTAALAAVLSIALAGCAGGSSTPAPAASQPASRSSAPPTGAPVTPAPRATATAATVGETGASVRVVNLWALTTGPGPDVAVVTDRDDPPLLRVGYGEVSDYLAVPLEAIPDDYESLIAFPADDIGNSTGSPWEFFETGQRVTAIVHGLEHGGVSEMTTHVFWESGTPDERIYFFGHGPAWPATPPGKALVLLYAGALDPLPSDIEQWWYATGGACLVDAATGLPSATKTGLDPTFFVLEPGRHEIIASATGCGGAAGFPGATVEVRAGDRVGVFPYGTGRDDLQFLVLPLGSE